MPGPLGVLCSGEHMSLRIIECKTSRMGIVLRLIKIRATGLFIVQGIFCQFQAKFSSWQHVSTLFLTMELHDVERLVDDKVGASLWSRKADILKEIGNRLEK